MLKKDNRLSKIKRSGGESFSSFLFNVRVFENKGAGVKFGFVVSKKIDKRAVVRNKTKRVLNLAAENLLGKVTDKSIVIFAKKKLEFQQRAEVAKELESLLRKAKILK